MFSHGFHCLAVTDVSSLDYGKLAKINLSVQKGFASDLQGFHTSFTPMGYFRRGLFCTLFLFIRVFTVVFYQIRILLMILFSISFVIRVCLHDRFSRICESNLKLTRYIPDYS